MVQLCILRIEFIFNKNYLNNYFTYYPNIKIKLLNQLHKLITWLYILTLDKMPNFVLRECHTLLGLCQRTLIHHEFHQNVYSVSEKSNSDDYQCNTHT